MKILKIIKERKAYRTYLKRPINRITLNKIIEAGIWGPSLHGTQPWEFVIVQNKDLRSKIINCLVNKCKKIKLPSFILIPTIKALSNANVILCVYNNKVFSKFALRINKLYSKNAEIAEISAISAAIQNMILIAEELKLGTCWLDVPLFCKKDISSILNKANSELIAVITLGHPIPNDAIRSPRKITKNTVIYKK